MFGAVGRLSPSKSGCNVWEMTMAKKGSNVMSPEIHHHAATKSAYRSLDHFVSSSDN